MFSEDEEDCEAVELGESTGTNEDEDPSEIEDVPVVLAEEERFRGIEEKPVQKFFVNAGIYVLEPETFSHIPAKQKFDMPSLFEALQRKGFVSNVFHVMEYWMDLGHIDELKKAQGQFWEIFK